MPRFAVVACSRCHTAWSVETRHHTSSCPRCPAMADLRKRRRLWEGDSPEDARQAAAAVNTAVSRGRPVAEAAQALATTVLPSRAVRHDSILDAAAAKARSLANLSRRAEAVALWLTRLQGPTSEAETLEALQKAGLGAARAEKEIVRMLATDILYEPRAGWYATLAT